MLIEPYYFFGSTLKQVECFDSLSLNSRVMLYFTVTWSQDTPRLPISAPETCSGGWGRRTLGLRQLVQERACEVKPWTRDELSPVPSRSLPLTRADASSHTRGVTWGAKAHSWDIQGCGRSSVQPALGVWGSERFTPQVPARGWCQVPGGPCFPELMAGGPAQSDCRVAPVADGIDEGQGRGQGPFGDNNVLMKTSCSSFTSWGRGGKEGTHFSGIGKGHPPVHRDQPHPC